MSSYLITGVSTGIGRALAELAVERGNTVIGTVRDPDCPDAARCPDGLTLEALDLDSPGSSRELGERVLARHGCPDVIVASAGTLAFGPLETVSPSELERIYRINVVGQLELVQALAPAMRDRGSGTIALVTSLGGTMVFPFFGAYNSSKWALEAIAEGLWHEMLPFGVRVKAIEPGYVETAIWSKALPGQSDTLAEYPDAYRPFISAMLDFEKTITDRTPPRASAVEILAAIADDSHRLRYPVAAYARPLVRARRWLGGQWIMRFFHKRWMGPNAG